MIETIEAIVLGLMLGVAAVMIAQALRWAVRVVAIETAAWNHRRIVRKWIRDARPVLWQHDPEWQPTSRREKSHKPRITDVCVHCDGPADPETGRPLCRPCATEETDGKH